MKNKLLTGKAGMSYLQMIILIAWIFGFCFVISGGVVGADPSSAVVKMGTIAEAKTSGLNLFTDGDRQAIDIIGKNLKVESVIAKDGQVFMTDKIGNVGLYNQETGKLVQSYKFNPTLEHYEITSGNMPTNAKRTLFDPSTWFTQGTGADAIITGATWALIAYGAVKLVGSLLGIDNNKVDAAAYGAAAGFGTANLFATAKTGIFSETGGIGGLFGKWGPAANPIPWGIAVGIIVFALTYKSTETEVVVFNCHSWEAPVGGEDCEKCNEGDVPCSEYRCKSLGQACEILNAGTEQEKCAWVNPRDVKSPGISPWEDVLTSGYKYTDVRIRPPGDGSEPGRMKIIREGASDGCVKAWEHLEFGIVTIGPDNKAEPAQCKVDYNHTKTFDEMSYYFGETNMFLYNHSQKMSLPGPDAINALAPELQNDGVYSLYVRCRDANGNENIDEFVVRFCVEKGPDTTAPEIKSTSIRNNMPVQFEINETEIELYVNEPAECKWSRYDTSYDNMENEMMCQKNIWDINSDLVFTCKDTLTSIKDRQDNHFFFRCKDQPNADESVRNINTQSYKLTLKGTEPLVVIRTAPNETITGSTSVVSVELEVETDHGYNNGEATCYYYQEGEDENITMFETGGNIHKQKQDLGEGDYEYFFRCIDLGGNVAEGSTEFKVEVDNAEPIIARAYYDGTYLKIITNEKSNCRYDIKTCNYKFEDGIGMPIANSTEHFIEWETDKNFYIKCMDEDGNLPLPEDTCSIVIRAY